MIAAFLICIFLSLLFIVNYKSISIRTEIQSFSLIVGLCFLLMSFLVFKDYTHKESYRQGQIDALTGKIHYKIEIDSTKNWVEIKK